MALIKCPECAREISDKAINCPHCGYPLSQLDVTPQKIEDKKIFCPFCGAANKSTNESCIRCNAFLFSPERDDTEYNEENPLNIPVLKSTKSVALSEQPATVSVPSDPKGGIFTKVKCPRCRSLNFSPVDTKKKFSIGKALVGNTVGFLTFGPVGGVVGAATGINGKNSKTKFVCHNCGKIWEQKI